jgi:hypothetical protein
VLLFDEPALLECLRCTTERGCTPAQERAAPVVRGFVDTWLTLGVGVRRDVAGALLTIVRVRNDKTGEILPRLGEPLTMTFTQAFTPTGAR